MWSANISMFFIVMNTTQIEMFGKLIFNLIPIFMLIAVTSISINKKNLIYFISGFYIICLGIILKIFKNDIWPRRHLGYMEIPLGLAILIIMVFFFK